MSRKRRMFDIDMPPPEEIPVGKVPDRALGAGRRGPMAAAISENAESLRERGVAESAIRAENDRLAHEYVRAQRDGQVILRVALDEVHAERLVRDRADGPDPELEELKQSIRDVGLSNPIRVQVRGGGGYELVQGMRRLSAFRALHAETGETAFAHIPAAVMPESPAREDDYRRMVDENLVRKDISFAEMGMLARAYAEDPENRCPDVDRAVAVLFKSASYAKRSYIRAFAALIEALGPALEHPQAIPRNLGVELKRRMDADPDLVHRVTRALAAQPGRASDREVAILRGFLDAEPGSDRTLPTGKTSEAPASGRSARNPRTTFSLARGKAHAKCAASAGRLEVRYDVDFSALDRRTLEAALSAFFDVLDKGDGGQ